MNKHTPGPWTVGNVNEYWTDSISIDAPDGMGVVCCTTRGFGFYDKDGERAPAWPNARLIAAAPDLLARCKEALAAWEGTGPPITLDDLRAAISKAEGA